MPPDPRTTKTWASLAIALLAISFGSIFARLADWPPLVMAFSRCFIGALFFGMVSLSIGARVPSVESKSPSERKLHNRLIVLAGILLGTHLGLWIASLNHTSVSASVLLVETVPIWAALLSWLLRMDAPGPKTWMGIGLSLVGVVVISLSTGLGTSSTFGNVLALGGAVTLAGSLMVGRIVLKAMDPLTYIRRLYTAAAALLLVPVVLSQPSTAQMPLSGLPWLLAMCFGAQIIGHTLVNRSLVVLPTAKVSVALLSETIFATLWAWMIFAERPTFGFWIGAALITLGVVQAIYDSNPTSQPTEGKLGTDAPS